MPQAEGSDAASVYRDKRQLFFFFFLSVEGEIIFLSHLVGKRLS